jgi:hypothetical protein
MLENNLTSLSQLKTLASGFIVPNSGLIEVINPEEDSIMDIILNRYSDKDKIKDFYSTYEIYQSSVINNAYQEYCKEASFDNYYNLIELLYKALSKISFTEWCMIQFSSNFMTNLARKCFFSLLENIYQGKQLQRGLIYAPITLTINIFNVTRSQGCIDKDIKRYNEIRCGINFNWVDVIYELTKNRTLADFVHVVFSPKMEF